MTDDDPAQKPKGEGQEVRANIADDLRRYKSSLDADLNRVLRWSSLGFAALTLLGIALLMWFRRSS